ncbi:MAG: hypothetical protein V4604_11960 [Bacteroidota bacterium]
MMVEIIVITASTVLMVSVYILLNGLYYDEWFDTLDRDEYIRHMNRKTQEELDYIMSALLELHKVSSPAMIEGIQKKRPHLKDVGIIQDRLELLRDNYEFVKNEVPDLKKIMNPNIDSEELRLYGLNFWRLSGKGWLFLEEHKSFRRMARRYRLKTIWAVTMGIMAIVTLILTIIKS